MTTHDDHRRSPERPDNEGFGAGYARSEERRAVSRDAMRVFEALRNVPEAIAPAETPADDMRGEPDEEDLRSILADIGVSARTVEDSGTVARALHIASAEEFSEDEVSDDDAFLSGDDESDVYADDDDLADDEDEAEDAGFVGSRDEPVSEAGMDLAGAEEDSVDEDYDDDALLSDADEGDVEAIADDFAEPGDAESLEARDEAVAETEMDLADETDVNAEDSGAARDDDLWMDDDEDPAADDRDEQNRALSPENEEFGAAPGEVGGEIEFEAEDDDDPADMTASDEGPDLGLADTGSADGDDAPDEEWEGEDLFLATAVPASFRSIDDADEPGRKPRIALMGEFSAGKSTLSNLLIGSSPLPVRVTATQLPPVWIAHGRGPAYCEDLDGETYTIDLDRLTDVDPAETRVVRIFQQSEFLELCDIIDMPGISDPNMSPEVWERVIGKADGVIWCTHATQAWRQSEAAVWESLDPELRDRSLLLVTRFDKLLTEDDRRRVMKRVARETEGLFAARLPISLTQAMSAGDDAEVWARSGAEAFTEAFVDLLHGISKRIGGKPTDRAARPMSRSHRPMSGIPAPDAHGEADAAELRPVTPTRIIPTRVRPVSVSARRPSARPDPASREPHSPF